MDKQILDIMESVFETEGLDNTVNQDNCEEWDSLHHLSLIAELEDAFHVEFDPMEISEMKSFEDVKTILAKKVK